MNPAKKVDQDDVLRARMLLLGSGYVSLDQEIEAYRVLAEVSPMAYLPKLAEALVSKGYRTELWDRPDMQLALHTEAVATARRIEANHPKRTEVLVHALGAYQRDLYAVGRRAEGFAACEEMAEAGRWGFERGQVASPAYGQGRLTAVLAEEGRHQEAAEICGTIVQAVWPEAQAGLLWSMVEWAAELDAAGRHDAALEAFAALVDAGRGELESGIEPLAVLTWRHVHHAWMLDAAGRRAEAGAARKEALALLAGLRENGDRKEWISILPWWAHLLALSGRSAEPAASPSEPAPPFGADFGSWSPDIKQAYFDGLRILEEEVTALTEAARTDPHGHLAHLVSQHRRLTVRAALRHVHLSHHSLEALGPLFDEGVALARRLADLTGDADQGGREALGRALTDRSTFLVAAKQYGAAYDDFVEVIALLG
ncbi:hypothetical protein ABT174_19305 [Streptomyces sparsogenes]|uniref:hypothetical protein n=1 Tax=Streptomyces sparsogenes TaxID=67365 RepID=UPI00331BD326